MSIHTHETKACVPTSLIDDSLMQDALRLTGLKTKKEAVELGLKTLIRLKRQEGIKRFRGKLPWEGDLDELRGALSDA